MLHLSQRAASVLSLGALFVLASCSGRGDGSGAVPATQPMPPASIGANRTTQASSTQSGLLFVANHGNNVTGYARPYTGAPIATITNGVSDAYGVALDAAGHLFVTNVLLVVLDPMSSISQVKLDPNRTRLRPSFSFASSPNESDAPLTTSACPPFDTFLMYAKLAWTVSRACSNDTVRSSPKASRATSPRRPRTHSCGNAKRQAPTISTAVLRGRRGEGTQVASPCIASCDCRGGADPAASIGSTRQWPRRHAGGRRNFTS